MLATAVLSMLMYSGILAIGLEARSDSGALCLELRPGSAWGQDPQIKAPSSEAGMTRNQGRRQGGTWSCIFPREKSKDQLGDKINLRGAAGKKRLPQNFREEGARCTPLHLST